MSLIVLTAAVIAWAWSAEGHKAVATIAEDLLKQSGDFDRLHPILGDLHLADIATCPDEVREYERAHASQGYEMSAVCQQVFPNPPTGTASWHFINIPVSVSNPTDAQINTYCGNNCAVAQINRFGAVLADSSKSQSERLQALSFIVHFVGDIHQPLHTAVRDNDAGGNAEQIRINGNKTSLHHAWDEPLVSAIDANPNALAQTLSQEIQAADAEKNAPVNDWVRQAFAYAQSIVYPGIPAANGNQVVATLDQAYQQRAEPVIRQQIARGGVHLAQFIRDHLTGGGDAHANDLALAPPSAGGAMATSISPDWDKFDPAVTKFRNADGTICRDGGDDNDRTTYRYKDRTDMADDHQATYRRVTVSAIRALPDFPDAHTKYLDSNNFPSADRQQVMHYEGIPVEVGAYMVANLRTESGEATNCGSKAATDVDWHLVMGQNEDSPADSFFAEITPRVRAQHTHWKKADFTSGVHLRLQGWLMYDPDHRNQMTQHLRNTLWEVHPIVKIWKEDSSGQWTDLDEVH